MGGEHMSFWPIFNIADASIFVGVTFMIIFQNRFFGKKEEENKTATQEINQTEEGLAKE
jgi:signal peptidase II